MIDTAQRRNARESGPWVQVSRLGNPLFNEVIVPLGQKDRWNASHPAGDKAFAEYVRAPGAGQAPARCSTRACSRTSPALKADRADLVAILLTGLPPGDRPGVPELHRATTLADMLRLNVAIPPTTPSRARSASSAATCAGFPNGRRVFDDVVTIELRAIAGVTYPLVNRTSSPTPRLGQLTQGLTPGKNRYQSTFPYLGTPHDGFDTPSGPKG